MPFIVVGLGNPGDEYDGTRHNVGFAVIDELCRRLGRRLRQEEGEVAAVRVRMGSAAALLVKPMTYMNNSGSAVAGVMAAEGATPGDLIVVVDDFALPLGALRIRTRGSDGGHNGLASILMALGSDAFPRVRCGIRSEPMPATSRRADFVLSRFAAGEGATAQMMIVRAADAVHTILGEGIATAMNRYNT